MSFNIALSGLNAATTDLGTIANNIANANTTGFKASRTEFGDFFRVSAFDVSGAASGSGVYVQRVAQQFGQGTITNTGRPLDLSIRGEGFFTLSDNGSRVYSRAGAFTTDSGGFVVNSSGQRLQVYPAQTTGAAFNTGTLRDLQLSTATNPPKFTSEIGVGVNLPADADVPATATFDPNDSTSYNNTTSATVYDSLGAPHTASMYFSKTATAGDWQVNVTIDGNAVGTASTVSFDASGVMTAPANGQLALASYTTTNGSLPLDITLDLAGATQYGDSFGVGSMTQDGYPTGQLSGLSITEDGVVQARYTNGQVSPLGQLALANFPNQQGLQQLGSAGWAETFTSGQAVLGSPGGNNLGAVQSGGLESSNVDLTEQLVGMMTAQRSYQANSQVISTTDQLLQTIMNLR